MNNNFGDFPREPQKPKNQGFTTLALYWILVFFCIVAAVILSWQPNKPTEQNNKPTEQNNKPTEQNNNATKNELSYQVIDSNLKIKKSYGLTSAECYIAVKNTGSKDLFLKDISIDIENKDGNLVDVLENVSAYPQIIAPGEIAYYYTNSIVSNIDVKSNYKISYDLNIEKSSKSLIRLSISDVVVSKNSVWEAQAVGRVTNTSSATLSIYFVSILLFDKNNNLIGCEYDVLYDDIAPKATKSFSISFIYFDGKYEDIASYKVYSYPHQYQFS